MTDKQIAEAVDAAACRLRERGLADWQIRDAFLGYAVGLATRDGWTAEQIANVVCAYHEVFALTLEGAATRGGDG